MSYSAITILEWATAGNAERQRLLTRNRAADGPNNALQSSISELIDDVAARGDRALIDALERFDGIASERIRVADNEFAKARAIVPDEVHEAIRVAVERSRVFNQHIVERAAWSASDGLGGSIGEIVRPIESAGLFVPSGKGSFPSVLIQIGAAAVTAGVPRIAVVVPPSPGGDGGVDPATLVVADELGLREVFRLNGPSGIAALAYGTQSVPKVGKIVGPGSPAVETAQRLVQASGCVVAGGLGPTDSLIIADGAADPVMLAADVINEAEHGLDSSAVLVSIDRPLLAAVAKQIDEQLAALPEPRRGYAHTSISANGGLVLAEDRAEALVIANDYASEHVQLAVANPDEWLAGITHAGTVLCGQWTTFAASNFVIGTPATLPTTGLAKYLSGVTAHTYLNTIATASTTRDGFWALAGHIEALATHEGFPAHRASVAIRRTHNR